jgi:hypothetical protein
MEKYLVLALSVCFSLPGCAPKNSSSAIVQGIYGNPAVLTRQGYSLGGLGINAVFVHKGIITPDLMRQMRQEDIKVFAEFPLLNGKEYLESHPQAWPIDSNGNRSPQADWFMGVCPTHPDFRKFRETQLVQLISTHAVDGIWLDYVHWHAQFESPDPILPETCFCSYCLEDFSNSSQVKLPDGNIKSIASWILREKNPEWRKWRSEVIVRWVRDFKTVLRQYLPEAKLGVYYCPWYPGDFNGAGYDILGLDIPALYREADVLSPMLYHGRMGRKPEWVKAYLEWFQQEIIAHHGPGAAVWPIVQASNEGAVVSPAEFRRVMMMGATRPASGIMMFSTHAFREDTLKIDVMKDLYQNGLRTTNMED